MKIYIVLLCFLSIVSCSSVPSGFTSSEQVEAALQGKEKEFVLMKVGAPNSKVQVDENIESWTYTSFSAGPTGGECTMTITFIENVVKKTVLNAGDKSWVSYPLGSCKNILKDL